MIDCSETKAAAISLAMGPQTSIIYCHWHFLKAVVAASKQKIKANNILPALERAADAKTQRDKAVQGVVKLMKAKTEELHNQLWDDYLLEWKSEELWIKYVKDQWEH